MARKFLSAEEVMSLYGVSPEGLQSLVANGDLRQLMDRGTAKFRREDVEQLASEGKFSGAGDRQTLDSSILTDESSHGLTLGGDDLQFLDVDIDEDALSEQPTMISKSSPLEGGSGSGPELQSFATPASSGDNAILEPAEGDRSDSDILVQGSESSTSFVGSGSMLDFGSSTEMAPPQETGVTEEEDDSLTLATDESTLHSGSSSIFEGGESSVMAAPGSESGLSLSSTVGPTLDPGESGISLTKDDSGLSLTAGDSGISMSPGDSGIALDHSSKTEYELAPSPSSEILLGDELHSEQTLELELNDEDEDVMGFLQPPSGKSAPAKSGSLSDQFATGSDSVQDLDIVDELDGASGSSAELIEAISDDDGVDELEEVFEASDESFGEAETFDDEFAPVAAKSRGPREPSWGIGSVVGLAAASLILAVNGWMAYEGVATMWTGDETSGIASSIISSIAGLY
ncbi:helix-turn-helix domain-containing protein [Planctellipticum variicoloris]|jgi:hypothetical protein|uniref:helix-turn-helix domain-containing protein n=1 Tax=Planctellipticum variicoloris TaxID=3064265 RepID=UPI0030133BF4|nr:helix-turn-helix domain-containing protein [Planctomycetaceae bacterium SH412]